ncbi:PAS domain S-box protein [Roseiflexus castenholzii]|uniref:PAS domain S-box protein n=1 Tax=Roseiflexus castenholzii TaxID=120962 RepID=UPI0000E7CA53|nr:PAS domain S-box protein [Roseiflexus castenholzii]
MTATNANITTLEAENAALRQRVSNLEARLASSSGVTATTTNHAIIEELRSFRTLVETAPQAISIANIDGVITYANPAFHELIGYDTLIGVSLMALHFEEDLPTIQAHVQDVMRSGIWRGSARLRHRNGHAIPVRINAFVIRNDAGHPVAMTGMFEDLTAEVQREERLRLFEALVENAPDAIGVADFAGAILYANAAYKALTGYGDDLIGMNGFDYIHDEDYRAAQVTLARLAEGKAAFLEARIRRKDGGIVPVAATMYTQMSPNDTPRIIGFLRDISAQKRAEEERFALQQQVIDAQRAAIRELSTPLIPISETAVIMPLVGAIDSARAQQIVDALLEGVAAYRAEMAIVDITGVQVVDTQVANALRGAGGAAAGRAGGADRHQAAGGADAGATGGEPGRHPHRRHVADRRAPGAG